VSRRGDTTTLFDLANGPMLTPAQRKQLAAKPGKKGHVMPSGTGPEGETCGSCRHLFRNVMSKTYLKCELNRAKWTGGAGTDVRAGDASCSKWERKE
jgi:hypothetical protein